MKVFHTVNDIRSVVHGLRCDGQSIALVPTMGSLHDGHLRLVSRGREMADVCVVSIFVNPTQFGEGEDFDFYPRDLDRDIEKLNEVCPDALVFAPPVTEMYPDGLNRTWITNTEMATYLCGASRPGHFRGVLTVVSKLFSSCPADYAVFGLKDVQQFYLIRQMTKDLNMDIQLEGVPTVREVDGLALSSRNKNLSPEERDQAVALSRAVSVARSAINAGIRDGSEIERMVRESLAEADLGKIDYAQVVLASTLAPVSVIKSGETIIAAVAVNFEKARLIDNAIIDVP